MGPGVTSDLCMNERNKPPGTVEYRERVKWSNIELIDALLTSRYVNIVRLPNSVDEYQVCILVYQCNK